MIYDRNVNKRILENLEKRFSKFDNKKQIIVTRRLKGGRVEKHKIWFEGEGLVIKPYGQLQRECKVEDLEYIHKIAEPGSGWQFQLVDLEPQVEK